MYQPLWCAGVSRHSTGVLDLIRVCARTGCVHHAARGDHNGMNREFINVGQRPHKLTICLASMLSCCIERGLP